MHSIDLTWILRALPFAAVIALNGMTVCADERASEDELIAYEGFDYEDSDGGLVGLNGGVGFTGPWQTGGMPSSSCPNYKLATGKVEGIDVVSTGKMMRASFANTMTGMRRMLRRRVGIEGETIYFSAILRPTGSLGEGIYDGFFGLYLDSNEGQDLFLGGHRTSFLCDARGHRGGEIPNPRIVAEVPVFFVVRIDFRPGNEVIQIFANPGRSSEDPMPSAKLTTVNLQGIDAIAIFSTGSFDIDELRLGRTFASVSPFLPEQHARLVEAAENRTAMQSKSFELEVEGKVIDVPFDHKNFVEVKLGGAGSEPSGDAQKSAATQRFLFCLAPFDQEGPTTPRTRHIVGLLVKPTPAKELIGGKAGIRRLATVMKSLHSDVQNEVVSRLQNRPTDAEMKLIELVESEEQFASWTLLKEETSGTEKTICIASQALVVIHNQLLQVECASPYSSVDDVKWVKENVRTVAQNIVSAVSNRE